MRIISNTDTICAIATPQGMGGIGVVRISGPASFDVFERIWRGRTPPADFEPRKLYLGEVDLTQYAIRNTHNGFSDKVMAVKMPAPHTYTGQDVVELSCHGSQVILTKIVERCVEAGARMAEPGEFTRRAFLAGKMDLAQAEAVCDLISATSERGARVAADQLAGKLSQEVEGISAMFTDLRGEVEGSIDFPEDGVEVSGAGFEKRASEIRDRIDRLTATFSSGRLAKDGVRVAIVGKPNSGKSSILNRLVGTERAIVHHAPGTTRDVVEESVSIDGVAFRLRDTAGIRDAEHAVEAMGVDLAREEIDLADVVLAVFDGSKPFEDADSEVLRNLGSVQSIAVINKSDLYQKLDLGEEGAISVSAMSGDGFDALQNALSSCAATGASNAESVQITSKRHRDALEKAGAALSDSIRAYGDREPAECVAQHLRIAHESIGEITGAVTTDDLLDRIFARFCIGK